MRTDHEVAQAVLQGLEWSSFVATTHPDRPGFRRACPICCQPQPFDETDPAAGHAVDCLLAAALASPPQAATPEAATPEATVPEPLAATTPSRPHEAPARTGLADPQAVPRLLDRYRHAVAVQTASRIRYGRKAERPAEKEAEARSRLEDALSWQMPAPNESAASSDRARIAALEERLAAAYEIVGSLAYGLGQFHHPKVIAALDYLSDLEGAQNPLPFPSLRPSPSAPTR